MTKVSILLTSYNHQDYIKRSINSILNQTFRDYELIIVDDYSTDNSWNIICSFKDKRIKKIRNKKNMGSILNSKLVDTFKGEYIAVAHCDDMWEKDKLEKQVKFLDENNEYAACFTGVKLIDELDEELSVDNYLDFNVENRSRYEWLNYFFYYGNCLCHPSLLIRTKIQKKESLYSKGLGALPDMYRWVKLCLKHNIYVYPEKLTYFRIRKGGANTSGYNYNNIVRVSFDTYKLLELYKSLSKDDFLKVFPQSIQYNKNDYFNTNFALARICLDEIGLGNYRLFGLNLIYELLQDKKQEENLKKYYNYENKDFIQETGNNDIFNVIDYNKMIDSSLYYSLGEGYLENNKITKKVLIKNDATFDVIFNDINLNVDGIRFDPIEGKFQKYSDINIYVNGKKIKYKTNAQKIENDSYTFYTLDPWFEIEYKGKLESVYISGKCENIELNEPLEYIINKNTEDVIEKTIKEIESKKLFNKIKNKLFK